MPLKTPEEKKNAVKWIINQLKIFGTTIVVGLGSVWGIAQYYLEDYVTETVHKVLEEKGANKSFREILGEQLDIPTDIVPYHLTEKLNTIDSILVEVSEFEDKYKKHLDFQLRISPMYRFIDEDGIEWWMGPDRRPHGVLFDEGKAWCVYSNRKVIIGDSY